MLKAEPCGLLFVFICVIHIDPHMEQPLMFAITRCGGTSWACVSPSHDLCAMCVHGESISHIAACAAGFVPARVSAQAEAVDHCLESLLLAASWASS